MPSMFYELTPLTSLEEAMSQVRKGFSAFDWLEKEWVFLRLDFLYLGHCVPLQEGSPIIRKFQLIEAEPETSW